MRLLLEDSPEAPALSQVVDSIQSAVAEWSSVPSSSSQPQVLLSSLEYIYHDVINHALFHQVDTLLTILHHLCPLISATSIISIWFDLLLRPALREPRLPTSGVGYAKELILAALEKGDDDNADKLRDFRRRLMDLYLLDAYNESSGDDALEWAGLDQGQRDRKAHWKANLQGVLVMFGLKCPRDLMSEIFHCFATPSSRLQLLILLNSYSSDPSFPPLSPILAEHPLLNSLILSLELDNSSTACAVGLSFFAKLFLLFAFHAPHVLKNNLPRFLMIFARMVCWEARHPSIFLFPNTEWSEDVEHTEKVGQDDSVLTHNCSHLEWDRLESTFESTLSTAPSVDLYFTHLYYLFPRNVLEFIRSPVAYLEQAGTECPHASGWAEALDEDKIRKKSERLLREHVIHTSLLSNQDTTAELNEPFWREFDIARIVGECTMMNVCGAVVGSSQKPPSPVLKSSANLLSRSLPRSSASDSSRMAETIHRTGRFRVSMHDVVATSVALRSGMDVDIDYDDMMSGWPNLLFSSSAASSPTRRSLSLPPDGKLYQDKDKDFPLYVTEVISRLQKELLLSRNELNLELWLARKNMQHIARLNQDQVLAQSAEGERQGLHNKMREYKADVARLQKELKTHKEQASSAKNKYVDWNAELQQKLREFREQRRTWTHEISKLRAENTELKTTFEAQGKLLATATNRVFELETTIKETATKVDRLHDYEKQIAQLIDTQRLWEDDTLKLNEQMEQMRVMESDYQGMKLLVKSYQEGRSELETEIRTSRERLHTLEAHLSLAQQKLAEASDKKVKAFAKASEAAHSNLAKTNERLREDNANLLDEIEELREMVEILKTRDKVGLISADPSSSRRMSFSNR